MNNLNQQTRRSNWRRIVDSRLVNALAAPHGMGRYLESVNPMWSLDSQRIRARVTDIRRETAGAVTIELKPNGEWTGFKAGQFVQVSVEINGRQQTRCYSLSCTEGRRRPTITVKAQADGFVSKYINEDLAVGDLLTVSPAMGEFTLPADLPSELLFIGAGSGITPLKSMTETLLAAGYSGQITLVYYNRLPADTIFHRDLLKLAASRKNFRLVRAFETDGSGELQGRFSPDQLPKVGSDALTYVCGPAGLMDAVTKHYTETGQIEQLRLERFGSPVSATINADEVSGEVRYARSERLSVNDGRSLLDQAEAAGLRPESGCRMGICHTCTCQKTAGAVRNIQTGEITHGEEQIRICVSQAIGDVTLDI